jgi:hypothetical protein
MAERRSVGSFIWPHLAAHEPVEAQPVRRDQISPLAAAMYPSHLPKPPPPAPKPRLDARGNFSGLFSQHGRRNCAALGLSENRESLNGHR